LQTATHLGEGTIGDAIATRPPQEVVEPAGRNSFAVPGDLRHDPGKAFTTATVVSTDDYEKYPVPTEEESKTLRKVPGSLPVIAWALCLVELAERASYYGASTVFSNFIEFPLPQGRLTKLEFV
jgi:hypothetical protein